MLIHGRALEIIFALRGVAGRYMNVCQDTDAGKGMFTGQLNGYGVSMLVLKCPHNPRTGKPETRAPEQHPCPPLEAPGAGTPVRP